MSRTLNTGKKDDPPQRTYQSVLADIKAHPENHRHTFDELHSCCVIDGAVDLALMNAHESIDVGHGSKCDVTSGPCSCGAWH